MVGIFLFGCGMGHKVDFLGIVRSFFRSDFGQFGSLILLAREPSIITAEAYPPCWQVFMFTYLLVSASCAFAWLGQHCRFFLVGFMPVLLDMFSTFTTERPSIWFLSFSRLPNQILVMLGMRWWAARSFPWGFREFWKDELWSINSVGIVIAGHHKQQFRDGWSQENPRRVDLGLWRDYHRAANHPTKSYLCWAWAARYHGRQQLRPRLGWRRRRRGWRRDSNRRELRAETMGLRGP